MVILSYLYDVFFARLYPLPFPLSLMKPLTPKPYTPYPSQKGQILIELIVGVTIILFVGVSIAFSIATSIRGSEDARAKSTSLFLAQETAEGVRAFTLEDWNSLDGLATSSVNLYFTTTSANKWTWVTGTEVVSLNGIQYTRYFWSDEVYRSTSTGDIGSSGGFYDPSTRKVSVKLTWSTQGLGNGQFAYVFYVSRYLNTIFSQTDWSGGIAGEAVVTSATTTFATSTGVNSASTTGSLKLGQI